MATATSSTNSKKQLTTTQISDNKPDAFEGTPSFSVPGLTLEEGSDTAAVLQRILNTYNDLHLTLKHVHWNVVGPNFISVHQMIDPQVETIRGYADDVAERIATLGSSPQHPAPWSSSGTGTTTRSAGPVRSSTWPPSTPSTSG